MLVPAPSFVLFPFFGFLFNSNLLLFLGFVSEHFVLAFPFFPWGFPGFFPPVFPFPFVDFGFGVGVVKNFEELLSGGAFGFGLLGVGGF